MLGRLLSFILVCLSAGLGEAADKKGLPEDMHGVWVPAGQACPSPDSDGPSGVLRIQTEAYATRDRFCLRDGEVRSGRTVRARMICRQDGTLARRDVRLDRNGSAELILREGKSGARSFVRCSDAWSPWPGDLARIRELGRNFVTVNYTIKQRVNLGGKTYHDANTRYFTFDVRWDGLIDVTETIGKSDAFVRTSRSRVGEVIIDDTGSQVLWFFEGERLTRWRDRLSYYQANSLAIANAQLSCGGMEWILKPGEKSYRTITADGKQTGTILEASWDGGICSGQHSKDPFKRPNHLKLDIDFDESLPLQRACDNVKKDVPPREALEACTKLIAHASGSTPQALSHLHMGRATYLEKLGDEAGAAAAIDRSIELVPDDHLTRRLRGKNRLKAKDYDGAAADFRVALDVLKQMHAVYPEIPEMKERVIDTEISLHDTFSELAQSLALGDKLDEATAVTDDWIALDPRFPGSYEYKGRLQRARKDVDGLLVTLRAQLALVRHTSREAGLLSEIATIHQQRGQHEEALANWAEALEGDAFGTERMEALIGRARSFNAQQKYTEAAAELTKAVDYVLPTRNSATQEYKTKLEAERDKAHFMRALVRIKLNDPKQAYADLSKVIERRPDFVPARMSRARILQLIGKPELAAKDLHAVCDGGEADAVRQLQQRTKKKGVYSGPLDGRCTDTLKQALTACMSERTC